MKTTNCFRKDELGNITSSDPLHTSSLQQKRRRKRHTNSADAVSSRLPTLTNDEVSTADKRSVLDVSDVSHRSNSIFIDSDSTNQLAFYNPDHFGHRIGSSLSPPEMKTPRHYLTSRIGLNKNSLQFLSQILLFLLLLSAVLVCSLEADVDNNHNQQNSSFASAVNSTGQKSANISGANTVFAAFFQDIDAPHNRSKRYIPPDALTEVSINKTKVNAASSRHRRTPEEHQWLLAKREISFGNENDEYEAVESNVNPTAIRIHSRISRRQRRSPQQALEPTSKADDADAILDMIKRAKQRAKLLLRSPSGTSTTRSVVHDRNTTDLTESERAFVPLNEMLLVPPELRDGASPPATNETTTTISLQQLPSVAATLDVQAPPPASEEQPQQPQQPLPALPPYFFSNAIGFQPFTSLTAPGVPQTPSSPPADLNQTNELTSKSMTESKPSSAKPFKAGIFDMPAPDLYSQLQQLKQPDQLNTPQYMLAPPPPLRSPSVTQQRPAPPVAQERWQSPQQPPQFHPYQPNFQAENRNWLRPPMFPPPQNQPLPHRGAVLSTRFNVDKNYNTASQSSSQPVQQSTSPGSLPPPPPFNITDIYRMLGVDPLMLMGETSLYNSPPPDQSQSSQTTTYGNFPPQWNTLTAPLNATAANSSSDDNTKQTVTTYEYGNPLSVFSPAPKILPNGQLEQRRPQQNQQNDQKLVPFYEQQLIYDNTNASKPPVVKTNSFKIPATAFKQQQKLQEQANPQLMASAPSEMSFFPTGAGERSGNVIGGPMNALGSGRGGGSAAANGGYETFGTANQRPSQFFPFPFSSEAPSTKSTHKNLTKIEKEKLKQLASYKATRPASHFRGENDIILVQTQKPTDNVVVEIEHLTAPNKTTPVNTSKPFSFFDDDSGSNSSPTSGEDMMANMMGMVGGGANPDLFPPPPPFGGGGNPNEANTLNGRAMLPTNFFPPQFPGNPPQTDSGKLPKDDGTSSTTAFLLPTSANLNSFFGGMSSASANNSTQNSSIPPVSFIPFQDAQQYMTQFYNNPNQKELDVVYRYPQSQLANSTDNNTIANHDAMQLVLQKMYDDKQLPAPPDAYLPTANFSSEIANSQAPQLLSSAALEQRLYPSARSLSSESGVETPQKFDMSLMSKMTEDDDDQAVVRPVQREARRRIEIRAVMPNDAEQSNNRQQQQQEQERNVPIEPQYNDFNGQQQQTQHHERQFFGESSNRNTFDRQQSNMQRYRGRPGNDASLDPATRRISDALQARLLSPGVVGVPPVGVPAFGLYGSIPYFQVARINTGNGFATVLYYPEYGYDHGKLHIWPHPYFPQYIVGYLRKYGYRKGPLFAYGFDLHVPPFYGFGKHRKGFGPDPYADFISEQTIRQGELEALAGKYLSGRTLEDGNAGLARRTAINNATSATSLTISTYSNNASIPAGPPPSTFFTSAQMPTNAAAGGASSSALSPYNLTQILIQSSNGGGGGSTQLSGRAGEVNGGANDADDLASYIQTPDPVLIPGSKLPADTIITNLGLMSGLTDEQKELLRQREKQQQLPSLALLTQILSAKPPPPRLPSLAPLLPPAEEQQQQQNQQQIEQSEQDAVNIQIEPQQRTLDDVHRQDSEDVRNILRNINIERNRNFTVNAVEQQEQTSPPPTNTVSHKSINISFSSSAENKNDAPTVQQPSMNSTSSSLLTAVRPRRETLRSALQAMRNRIASFQLITADNNFR